MSLERVRAIVCGMVVGYALGLHEAHGGHTIAQDLSRIELAMNMTLLSKPYNNAHIWHTNALLIGYVFHDQLAELHSAAKRAWLFTDVEASPYGASLAAALAVAFSLRGLHDHEYARRIVEGCDGVSDSLDAAFYRLGHALAWSDERGAMEHIGRGRDDESLVSLACYCLMRYPTSFDLALRRAMSVGDERARLGYLVGGMMGAKLGLEGIPPAWLAICPKLSF